MADDYDADLAEAIKRSLLDQPNNAEPTPTGSTRATKLISGPTAKQESKTPIIILDDSDDDDKGDKASVKNSIDKEGPIKKEVNEEKTKPPTMLNLDRAQMERERLSRLKRKGPDDSHVPQAKHVKSLDTKNLGVKKEGFNNPTSPSRPLGSSSVSNNAGSSSSSVGGGGGGARNPFMTIRDLQKRVSYYVPQKYLDSVVKKTYVQGLDRTSDDITIEEVLQKDTLQTAVLSAFVWDFLWILEKLKVKESDLVLVLSAKEDEMVDHYRRNLCNIPRTRLCFPDMSGNINCMHSKLQLLFHLTYLRVVVPTANLTPYDWGEAIGRGNREGVMENMVFIIDFPELPKTSTTGPSNPSHTPFSRELLHFCKAKGLPADIIEKVDKVYDFTRSQNLGFVYSIGGSHLGDDAFRNGVCGLAKAVKDLRLKTQKRVEVDYVTSSVGSLNKEFLLRMYRAIHGDNGKKSVQGIPKKYSHLQQTKPEDESTASETEEEYGSDDKAWKEVKDSMRIYFPSRSTVASSKGGIENGGTICFQQKWFNTPSFPTSLLHDCQSKRRGMLMHNKIIYVRYTKPKAKALGWAYVGSANLSESAWGKLIWDRSQKQFKMSNRNWECGVLMPVASQQDGQKEELAQDQTGASDSTNISSGTEAKVSVPDLSVFANVIPIPMSTPAPLLSSQNPPWYFGELRGNP
ncbi:hypothetical protein TWF694_007494 [Orbilia ellipsospora]|uniref:PLD phosphodiesterase domain-containing protein n=1 Tax=Orbilia ellipsospora TaxID=2528407 RepID=A0AAV9XJK1_9PEZI